MDRKKLVAFLVSFVVCALVAAIFHLAGCGDDYVLAALIAAPIVAWGYRALFRQEVQLSDQEQTDAGTSRGSREVQLSDQEQTDAGTSRGSRIAYAALAGLVAAVVTFAVCYWLLTVTWAREPTGDIDFVWFINEISGFLLIFCLPTLSIIVGVITGIVTYRRLP